MAQDLSMRGSRTRGIGMTSQRTRDRMVARLRDQGIMNEDVLAAMAAVPRHIFVDEGISSWAYEDKSLPIGFEQTISQPFVIAAMIQAVIGGGRVLGRVLEVGTGCGYQAAVLAKLAKEVYSMERIAALLDKARANLRELRIPNLRLVHGDGTRGLPDAAPYDAIVVAAAMPRIPGALREQLAVDGRLIAPVGARSQALCLVERTKTGFREQWLDAVRFVPLRMGKQ